MMYAMDLQLEKASEYYAKSLEIQEANECDKETLMDTLYNYGLTLFHMGDLKAAKAHFNKALKLCEANPELSDHLHSIQTTLQRLENEVQSF